MDIYLMPIFFALQEVSSLSSPARKALLLDDSDDDDDDEKEDDNDVAKNNNKTGKNPEMIKKTKEKKKFGEKILTEAREAREAEAKLKEINEKLAQINNFNIINSDVNNDNNSNTNNSHWRQNVYDDGNEDEDNDAAFPAAAPTRLPTEVLRKLIDDAAKDLRITLTPTPPMALSERVGGGEDDDNGSVGNKAERWEVTDWNEERGGSAGGLGGRGFSAKRSGAGNTPNDVDQLDPIASRLSFAASEVSGVEDDDDNDDAVSTRTTTTTASETPHQMALAANGLISHAMLRELLQNPRATSAFSFVSCDEGVAMEGVVSIGPAVASASASEAPSPSLLR